MLPKKQIRADLMSHLHNLVTNTFEAMIVWQLMEINTTIHNSRTLKNAIEEALREA